MSKSVCLLLALLVAAATAQELPRRVFRIDPQPLSPALRSFAAQADMQLIFSEQDVRSLISTGLDATLTPREALATLLRGMPLEYEFTTNNVVVVRRAAPATAGTPPPQETKPTAPPAATTPEPPRRAPNNRPRRPAQTASASAPTAPTAPLSEVAITGTRITRRDMEAASPIVTLDARAFEETSTLGVESVLNQLPQFVPTETQFITTDLFPGGLNTPGSTTLNLRGLGTNRTLVLIDGRRAQPSNAALVVDVNSIPASAIASVEVITGGASATYGADAMAGVTNFKLRRDVQGLSFELHSGITEAGDGEESRVSALMGTQLAENRGNVMLGVEWTRREDASIYGRPFFENALTDPNAPSTAIRLDYASYEPNASDGGLPSQNAANALFPERATGTNVNRATAFFVNPDNSLFKDVGALGYTGELGTRFKVQPNGVLGENNLSLLVSSPLERYSIFGRGHYTVSNRVSAFAQALFASTNTRSVGQPSGATGGFGAFVPRDADHPVPAELGALLDSRGPDVLSTTEFDPRTGQPIVLSGVNARWRLGRTLDFLPPRQLDNTAQVFQLLAGLDGSVPVKDWTWEAYLSHGDTRNDARYVGFASLQRYRLLIAAPNYGRAFSETGPGLTGITCTSGLPVFEQFSVSQDCIDAISVDAVDRSQLSQDIVEANMQGGLTDLPAGELRGAIGATYRKNEFEFRPDSIRESHSITDLPIGVFPNARVSGRTNVKEAYAELLVPLLKEKPFARSLQLELGGRYSDYDTAGGVPTYKALFSWSPINTLRFRGGYQLANRAPNINELFLGASSVPVTMRGPDACRSDTRDLNGNHPDNPNRAQVQALCSAIIGSDTSTFDQSPSTFIGDGRTDGGEIEVRLGNSDLENEKGRTYTFGLVLTSPFESNLTRNLSVSLDWYRVRVTGAIAQVSAQTTYDLCFNRDGRSNPTYALDDPNGLCRRIQRDEVTGNRVLVNSPYANLGTLDTSGVDIEANWNVPLADLGLQRVPGTLSLNLLFNKLLEFKSQSFPTSEAAEAAGTLAPRGGQFDYRALTTLRYTLGDASVALTWRRLPSVRNAAFVTDPLTPFSGAASYSVYNLVGSWFVRDSLTVTAGIDNLLDRDPNPVGAGPGTNGAGTTSSGYYDVLGRRYYVGLRFDFAP